LIFQGFSTAADRNRTLRQSKKPHRKEVCTASNVHCTTFVQLSILFLVRPVNSQRSAGYPERWFLTGRWVGWVIVRYVQKRTFHLFLYF